jgi:hypothetical protein
MRAPHTFVTMTQCIPPTQIANNSIRGMFKPTLMRCVSNTLCKQSQENARFPFGEEKLVAPLIAIPNVDKANRRQEKGKKLN